MRIFGTLVIALVFVNSILAQSRLNPEVFASETEVCENEEVQLNLSYSEPNNTSVLLNGIDEHINFPANPAFNFGASTNFTIDFQMKTSTVVGTPGILVAKADGLSAGYSVAITSGVISVAISDGTNTVAFNGFTNIADGNWHNISIVVERTANATIYIDGFFDNDASVAGIGNIDNANLLTAGAGIAGGVNVGFYNGYLDELRLWNKALTVADINTVRVQHINPNTPLANGLVGYWDMNELTGPNLIDCSVTGASGTMVNSASLSLDAPPLSFTFNPVWSTGQTGDKTIFVNPLDTTTYLVQIGYCKYFGQDSVTVNVIPCDDIDRTGLISSVWVPSAFSPNGDNKNDVFLVQGSNLNYYEIMIFNRFGNIVYHSRNILNSWDGSFDDRRVEDDVYTWVVIYRDLDDVQHEKYGTVTVIR